MAESGGFTVAAIVRESEAVLRRFIDWYLGQGARRIVLFLDNPEDPLLPMLRAMPGVDPVPCTPAFWAGLGLTPEVRFPRRQNAAVTSAYRALESGWLLNVDADELMRFEGRTLAQAVEGFPEVRSVRVAPAEQVHLPGGGAAFRVAIDRKAVDRVYLDQTRLLRRRMGLVGHTEGKSFHRAGDPGLSLRQHWAVTASGEEVPAHMLGPADGAHLLHLAAPDFPAWRAKLEWRLSSSNLSNRLNRALDDLMTRGEDREAACLHLWQALYTLTPEQEARLEAEGGLLRVAVPGLPAAA